MNSFSSIGKDEAVNSKTKQKYNGEQYNKKVIINRKFKNNKQQQK